MQIERSKNQVRIITESPDETINLGKKIGSTLTGGEIFALIGPLGSGKTHIIKGIAVGANTASDAEVNSPTFVLVNEYHRPDGSLEIYHIDAYRLDSVSEFERLGFDDMCSPNSVVLIEWADKVLDALKNLHTITIELAHVNENKRQITIKNPPDHIFAPLSEI